MSGKYNNGDQYIGEPESMENRETGQLSAEEIAAVLAESYFGGRVVSGTEAADKEDKSGTDSRSAVETETAEKEREARRRKRVQEMRRRKKRQEQMRRLMLPCAVVFVVCALLAGIGIRSLVRKHAGRQGVKDITYDGSLNVAGCHPGSAVSDRINDELAQIGTLSVQTLGGRNSQPPLTAVADEATVLPDSEVVKSLNSIFIDVDAGRIMGQRDAGARISPASMTKILTVLVAAEHITDPDDTFEITMDITDYSFVNGCSNAGFEVGEIVTVRDLFYGTVLPSGADAALGLAIYVAGSHEAFVELMNEKIDELGLSRTSHFTNCVGLYDENHYSTVYDMAVMLKAASDNSFCREVLSAHIYTTSATEQHPEGITLSNWFLRKIEDKDTHGEVLCAKTGFVEQSRSCAASLSVGNDGKEYICVTAHAESSWLCIYDHVALCQQFLPDKGQSSTGGS